MPANPTAASNLLFHTWLDGLPFHAPAALLVLDDDTEVARPVAPPDPALLGRWLGAGLDSLGAFGGRGGSASSPSLLPL
jgi:hypothetical protein